MAIKIVLSRKGMDTSIGKLASPIFNKTNVLKMLSLPIPVLKENVEEYKQEKQREYFHKKINKAVKENYGNTYLEIITKLVKKNRNRKWEHDVYHYDPLVDEKVLDSCGYQASLGQSKQAAKYLKSGFKKGDTIIFLFFGRFHFVDDEFKYIKKSGDPYKDNDIHVVWGSLIIKEYGKKQEEIDLNWHPHSIDYYKKQKENNIIFTGKGQVYDFSKSRVLTKLERKCGREISMAIWDKKKIINSNEVEDYIKFSEQSTRKNTAANKSDELYLRGQWQELIIDQDCEYLLQQLNLEYDPVENILVEANNKKYVSN